MELENKWIVKYGDDHKLQGEKSIFFFFGNSYIT
jgi:hypothetical protein